MSSPRSQVLSLPYLRPSQAQKHVTHNDALRLLDILVQLVVSSRTTSTPPSDPPEGRRHVVPEGATGAWSGAAGMLAVFQDGEWRFITPLVGWQAYVKDENIHVTFEAGSWIVIAPPSDIQSVTQLGVNTSADATNRLAVSAANTLLTHAGSDHRLKINKAGSGDTASLLFQNAFTGHAEMGLTGAENFSLRVSPDGNSWTTGLIVDRTSGTAAAPAGLEVSGALTGDGVVGTVSQVGGLSTGAIIERGSNANGEYVRWADGTQICRHRATLTADITRARGSLFDSAFGDSWTYPASFTAQPRVMATISDGGGASALVLSVKLATPGLSSALIDLFAATNLIGVNVSVDLVAFGRWY